MTHPYIGVFILHTTEGCTEHTVTNEITVSNDANNMEFGCQMKKDKVLMVVTPYYSYILMVV
jgi:hypothetical protein